MFAGTSAIAYAPRNTIIFFQKKIKTRKNQGVCWLKILPNANSPKKTPASTDRKYPTLKVMTANILQQSQYSLLS